MKKIACLVLVAALLASCVVPVLAEAWNCGECGAGNDRKFCTICGAAKPEKPRCAACGFEPQPGKTYKFCPECGYKFSVPVLIPETTPVPTPTPTPTPTPEPVPAKRSFYIDEITTKSNGNTSIHWQDSEKKDPYKVCYESLVDDDYNSAKQMATVRWVGAKDVAGDSAELPFLVPGAPYWITVFDADGEMAKVKFEPFKSDPFTDYTLTATLKPRVREGAEIKDLEAFAAADVLDSGTKEYGAHIRVVHDALKKDEVYRSVVAITCPDGVSFVESVNANLKLDKDSTSTYWEFYSLKGVFTKLKGIYNQIPTGQYTWTLYLDGFTAATTTFSIK